MSIFFDHEKKIFKLDTPTTSYVLGISPTGYLFHYYYGARVPECDLAYLKPAHRLTGFGATVPEVAEEGNACLDILWQEYPTNGLGDDRTAALQIRGANGNACTDIRYASHTITPGKPALAGLPATYTNADDEADTLELTCTDALTGATVTLLYTAFNHLDVITRSVRVENKGTAPFSLERILSTSLDLPDHDYDMLALEGRWAKERTLTRRPLGPGTQGIGSRRGASSHTNNPFLALARHGGSEESGEVYGFSFVYSGSFEAQVEVDSMGFSRVTMGIHTADFTWRLEPGETFTAPEVVMTFSQGGIGTMSRTYHKLYRYNLCRGEWKTKKRPILVNNWEATYFKFNGDKLVDIARDAADLGIEMLVMDDGWFGHRENAKSSLGDWTVNEEKLGGPLSALVERVNALGLKFGIWFEPEMISPDSDLYRAHPDWCLHVDGRRGSLGRNQLVLDMSRPEVRDNIFEQMSAVLSSANIEYVKWDFNRNLTEVGSAALPPERQGETAHRFMLGVYDLLERLLTAFPHLLLEGCSGGGGRFDPGMLYYSPQYWTSDDTDAIERLEIQYGTSIVYPPSTMSAHVSASPNHQTKRVSSFKTRGDVAMAGAFGYELDLTTLTDEERDLVRKQVADYHKYYNVVQNGDYYRLINPTVDAGRNTSAAAWMSVSQDKREALFTYVVMRTHTSVARYIRLRGLDPDRIYVDQESGARYSGALLMNAGLNLSGVWQDGESRVWHFIAE